MKPLKPVIRFKADQFNYNSKSRTFVAEASSLGLRPGEVPGKFTIEGARAEVGHEEMHFSFSHREFSGGDVVGWRYVRSQYAALIIND